MINQLLTPQGLLKQLDSVYPWLFWSALILLSIGLYGGLYMAPADYQQGDAFRIIYVHVPFAIWSLGFYSAMTVLSALYLVFKIKVLPSVIKGIAVPGALMTLLACFTGAVWGKPMWGTWWIWDARLTSELILFFIYLGYFALHTVTREAVLAAQLTAIYTLVGFINIPIIHFSVYWWNTLHQTATITRFGRPTIANDMLWPLLIMIVAIAMIGGIVTLNIVRSELLHQLIRKKGRTLCTGH